MRRRHEDISRWYAEALRTAQRRLALSALLRVALLLMGLATAAGAFGRLVPEPTAWGMPWRWLLVGGLSFPLLLVIAWTHAQASTRLEEEYLDLVKSESMR